MAITVNGELVEDERFYRAFLQLSGGRTPPQVQHHAASEFQPMLQQAEQAVVRAVLLHQYAQAEGLTSTADEVDAIRRAAWGSAANQSCGTGVTDDVARDLLARKAEAHLARHVPRPDRQEVEAVYRANASSFTLPERWLVSHIVRFAEDDDELLTAKESLANAQHELKRGKAFATVAERYSDCKGSGGSLGWIARGSMVAEFEAVVFALSRRTVSDIFATPFGVHIAVVQDHKPSGLQPLDEVRADLSRRIFDSRKQAHVDHVVSQLYQQARIEVLAEPQRTVASGEKVSG